jgi:phenylacetate-CoA ligase
MQTSIASSYKKIKQMQHYSRDEIHAWQEKRLKSLIDNAYSHSKYYYTLFKQTGLHPDDIKTTADLEKIPVLTKKIIRENFDDIISDNIDAIPHKKSATGGSTGDPTKYWLDHRSWSMSNANSIVNWEKVGYHYGDAYIALGSTSLFVDKKPSLKHQIYYKIKNKTGLNGINMSDDVCQEYIALIRKRKINFIYGYASSIYLLAKYASDNNQNLSIKACFPTSEILTDRFRKTIQDAFKCKILNCYGAHDGGITAFSHEREFFEVGYNSVVSIENPDTNGTGPALVTDLSNYAMPLINYKLGDEIRIDNSKNKNYPYNGQVINDVLGRTSDIIQLENGRTLTGPGFTILFKDLPVEHYSVVKNGANSIKCSVVKLSDFDQSHEDIIKSTFMKQMGENTNFKLEYTNEIPLSKSGKREYFKKS